MNELRFACRSLIKAPAFTIVAVVTLALGIGATTAIFSVVYGVLLRPLPYRDPSRLVLIEAWRDFSGRTVRSNPIARLKPGVTMAQAQANVDDVSRSLARGYPEQFANVRAR